METTISNPPVQYNHSITYNGLIDVIKNNNSRMTLRIEQTSPLTFLVTKAVCSYKDQFVKKTARDLCDQRAMVHNNCIANSTKYNADTVKLVYPGDIDVTIDCYSHDTNLGKDMAYVITFSKDPQPKTFHSIIFDLFRTGSFTYF